MWRPLRKTALASILFVGVVLAFAGTAEAQQTKKTPRIGYLVGSSPSADAARYEAFRQSLRELGYVEGKNIVIEARNAEGKSDRFPALVAELVRLKVDVIVTSGANTTRVAKEATTTIPIVFAQDGDPVANGFVASLARPGGNLTGLSTLSPELNGKRLELLKEIVPKLSRVAILGTSTVPGHARFLKETEPAAGALRLQLQFLDVLDPKDIETAFRAANKGRADGLVVLSGPVLSSHRARVLDLGVESRLPAIHNFPEWVEAGGLMTYGVNLNDLYRRAAIYVDKILKGAKPGDLPVEQPIKFEFIVNLKTARALGLDVPVHLQQIADEVIE